METKKTNKADLEGKKSLFFQIGIVATLALLLIAFEWTTPEVNTGYLGVLDGVVLEEVIIPVTRPEELIAPPPPPPQPSELLNIVNDDVNIIDEIFIADVQATSSTRIEITQFSMPKEESDEPILFVLIEDKPMFMGGGQEEFRNWVLSNIKYPQIAAENGIQGTVHLRFVINRDGSVSNIEIVRGVDQSLDREAIRVVSMSPRWEPGKQRGNPVRVSFSFPVTFRLN